jgi:hypothetical protein
MSGFVEGQGNLLNGIDSSYLIHEAAKEKYALAC